MAKYDEAKAVRILKKNKGVRINGTTIEVLVDSASVGNGSWGKIDYLTHYCGYVVNIVKHLGGKSAKINDSEDDNNTSRDTKAIKRANKLNMAAMAKASMKRVKTK